MNTDSIFTKYADALLATGEDGKLHGQAIALALRLAIGDGVNVGRTIAGHEAAVLREKLERQQSGLIDLQAALDDAQEDAASARRELTTLIAERDGLRQQITQMDANISALATDLRVAESERDTLRELCQAKKENEEMLIQQITQMDADNADLLNKVHQAQGEIDRLTRQNVIATDTFNSLAADRTNGAAAVSNVPAPGDAWADLDPDPETNDYRISLDAGRRKFREVPKRQRLLLAQAIARRIGAGALPKQSEFDAWKPDWMPGGAGLVTTFGCNWTELLTITPADVAP